MTPTEMQELRRTLASVLDVSTRTSQDVTWIKDGMKAGTDRVEKLERRAGRIESRQHWYSGAGAVLGAALTAFVSHIGFKT